MFQLYGFAHFAGLIATCIWAYLLYNLGKKNSRFNRIFSIASGFILLSFYFIFLFNKISLDVFSAVYHLPLQLSNLILFWTGLSLIFDKKIWYLMTMFWAFPGALISVLFPDIGHTFPHQDYWFFWVSHAVLLGFVLFLFHYRNYILTIRDCLISLAILTLYVVIVYPLNVYLGSNYGYLRELPPSVEIPESWNHPVVYIPIFFCTLMVISYLILLLHNYFHSKLIVNRFDGRPNM